MDFLQELLGAVQTWFQNKAQLEDVEIRLRDDLQRRREAEEERKRLERERELNRVGSVYQQAEAQLQHYSNTIYNQMLQKILSVFGLGLASIKAAKTPEERRAAAQQVMKNVNQMIQSLQGEIEQKLFEIEPHLDYVYGTDMSFADPRFLALRTRIQSEGLNVMNRLRQAVNEQLQNFLQQEALAGFGATPSTPSEGAKAAGEEFLKREKERVMSFVGETPPFTELGRMPTNIPPTTRPQPQAKPKMVETQRLQRPPVGTNQPKTQQKGQRR